MASEHDSPCGRMHLIANLYNDSAGYGDMLQGDTMNRLKRWPVWWLFAPNEGLDCCFVLVFHEPGVTQAEAEAFMRHEFEQGHLRDDWYESKPDSE
jgi:hypothetical protein